MTQEQTETQEPAVEILDGEGSASFAVPGTEAPADAASAAPEAPATEQPAAPAEVPLDLPEELRRPEPMVQPGLGDADQRELAQLRQRQTEFEQGRKIQQAEAELRDLEQEYIKNDNLDETTASYVAKKVRAERQRGLDAVADAEAVTQFEARRRHAAQELGKELGVNPAALLDTNDLPEMRRKAENIVYMAKQNKRIEALERDSIPDQHLAGGGQGQSVTSDTIDALYVQWDNDHPGQDHNPYAERFLKFLNGNA